MTLRTTRLCIGFIEIDENNVFLTVKVKGIRIWDYYDVKDFYTLISIFYSIFEFKITLNCVLNIFIFNYKKKKNFF